MSSNCEKSWNRPWSIPEIVDSAPNWSLAGDAGLLKYLETFSENLLSKAEETNTNLNTLLEDLSTASLSLDVIKNEFSSLHNVQFVESRVYEEDETLPVDQLQENVKDTKVTEEERIHDMKEAVLRGIDVIDKYYDKVQVPASDSEDETDFPSFVLRPKDPYLDRPLPYIIGSEDWYNKWHVGLLDSSSESETDKVSEKFSDSDSESDLPVQNRSQFKGISNSESEADLSNRRNINPVANSTFDESVKHPGIFGSSDSEENNSVPGQAPISNRSFAQELAAKLGNVIEQNTQVIEPEINKRPIQSAAAIPNRIIGNIFPDEPPPIDEDDIMFGKSSIQQGVFSGGGALFDDLDNSSGLWDEKRRQIQASLEVAAPKSKLPNLFDDEDDNIFNAGNSQANRTVGAENVPRNVTSKKIVEGLFDDDSSEDDLFNEGAKRPSFSKPFLPPVNKSTMPFFDNEPPEIQSRSVTSKEENVKPKKPFGGVKILEGADLFNHQKVGDLLKIRRQESSESSDKDENVPTNKTKVESPLRISDKPKDLFSDFDKSTVNKQNIDYTVTKDDTKDKISKEAVSNKPPETDTSAEKNLKQLSLFDDDDVVDDSGLFGDDLFSNISTKKFTSSLFEEKPLSNDLFAEVKVEVLDEPLSNNLFAEVKVEESNKLRSNDLFAEVKVEELNKPLSNDLFAEVKVEESNKPRSNDLFAEVKVIESSKPQGNDLFARANVDESSKPIDVKKQVPSLEKNSQLFSDNVFIEGQGSDSKKSSKKVQKDAETFKPTNLFRADSDDEGDDLFSTNKIAKSSQNSGVPIAAPRNLKSDLFTKDIPKTSESSKPHDDQKQDTSAESNVEDHLSKSGSVNINFFDQNPPDDDNDDWDTKSDNNLFEENDPTLFDNTPEISSHRSGLFDNEPPSLFYESSGIVRDVSTRAETDDSFNPYASSSRRFSTDIFNEQQSSDSFFITKNKSHLESQPSLGSIQEIWNPQHKGFSFSNVDITPSGNIDDLLPDSSVSISGASLPTGFSDDLQNDNAKDKSGDDLFGDSNLQGTSKSDLFTPSEKIAKIDILKGSQKDTEKIESNVLEKTNVKPVISTKPSSPLKKGEAGDNTPANPRGSTTPKIGSPGKLKHNLNINVGALLPGVSPPKRKDLEKSSSFEAPSSYEPSATEISSKSLSPYSTPSKSSEELTQDESQKSAGKPGTLESSSGLPEILPSITKDRVRIPVKRRPSTRRARQQSIRNSGIDFKINLESEQGSKSEEKDTQEDEIFPPSLSTENIFEKPKEVSKTRSILTSNALSDAPDVPFFDDSIGSDSLFADSTSSEGNIQTENVTADGNVKDIDDHIIVDQPKPKPDVPLFDDSMGSDLLFAANASTKTEKVTDDGNTKNITDHVVEDQLKPSIFGQAKRSVINSDSFESADFNKSDLFDDSEEFDDIFSSKKLPPKSKILKKSLFDDELDDDDIFGPSTSNDRNALVKNISESKPPLKKSAKIAQVKKLENTMAVEDPLSSFNE